jgi:hypothetical protein
MLLLGDIKMLRFIPISRNWSVSAFISHTVNGPAAAPAKALIGGILAPPTIQYIAKLHSNIFFGLLDSKYVLLYREWASGGTGEGAERPHVGTNESILQSRPCYHGNGQPLGKQ